MTTTSSYLVIGGAWESHPDTPGAFVHPVTGEHLAIGDEVEDTQAWDVEDRDLLDAYLAEHHVLVGDVYVALTPHTDDLDRPVWSTYRQVQS